MYAGKAGTPPKLFFSQNHQNYQTNIFYNSQVFQIFIFLASKVILFLY